MVRKVDMERFAVTSSKPFDAVVEAIKASIGHPNMAALWEATQRATTAAELKAAIQPALGESGLMQFVEFDHGTIVRKATEHHTSRIIRLIIGNPLIMKEMAKRVPDAGSYAPVMEARAEGFERSFEPLDGVLLLRSIKAFVVHSLHLQHNAEVTRLRKERRLIPEPVEVNVVVESGALLPRLDDSIQSQHHTTSTRGTPCFAASYRNLYFSDFARMRRNAGSLLVTQ
jgi:hypothetical protein